LVIAQLTIVTNAASAPSNIIGNVQLATRGNHCLQNQVKQLTVK
jgi:hypothetical protein